MNINCCICGETSSVMQVVKKKIYCLKHGRQRLQSIGEKPCKPQQRAYTTSKGVIYIGG